MGFLSRESPMVDGAGRPRRRRLAAAAVVTAALAQGLTGAVAQTQAPVASPATTAQTPAERRAALQAELDGILRDIDLGKERQAEIRAEIERAGRDRLRLGEQLVAAATRLQAAEARLSITEQRIGDLDRDVARARAALDARRGVLADVLAALQRIGRKPPPALLVRPEDALAAVRSAVLVGALLPELEDQAAALLSDLQAHEALKTAAAGERDRFRQEAADLVAERARLAGLVEERRRVESESEAGLEAERRRASVSAERAVSLRELLAALDQAAKTSPAPGAGPRLQPTIAFAEAKGRFGPPVGGEIVVRYGEDDGTGQPARGVTFVGRGDAAVTSPCDGDVIFAGPFRSYGKLLIINGGGGYHVVLAGLDRIDVDVGQFVLAGEPVGRLATRIAVRETGTGRTGDATGRPILYVEFRKDGASIDPSPWWARGRDEKVRG